MKSTVSKYEFVDEMSNKGNGFSWDGAGALYDYLEQLEQDCEEEFNFDPIAFRCEYNEYENFKAVQNDYKDIESIDDLENKTTVIEVPHTDKIIIQAY